MNTKKKIDLYFKILQDKRLLHIIVALHEELFIVLFLFCFSFLTKCYLGIQVWEKRTRLPSRNCRAPKDIPWLINLWENETFLSSPGVIKSVICFWARKTFKDISVIIKTYRSRIFLAACLFSLPMMYHVRECQLLVSFVKVCFIKRSFLSSVLQRTWEDV